MVVCVLRYRINHSTLILQSLSMLKETRVLDSKFGERKMLILKLLSRSTCFDNLDLPVKIKYSTTVLFGFKNSKQFVCIDRWLLSRLKCLGVRRRRRSRGGKKLISHRRHQHRTFNQLFPIVDVLLSCMQRPMVLITLT